MSGDLFDIRGAVYVEHDGHAKTLDGSSTLHTHCLFFNNFRTQVDGKERLFLLLWQRELRESRVSVSLSSAQKLGNDFDAS